MEQVTIRRNTENNQPLHRDVSHKPTDEQHLDEEFVGTTLEEERRTTEKAKVVGFCFGRDLLPDGSPKLGWAGKADRRIK